MIIFRGTKEDLQRVLEPLISKAEFESIYIEEAKEFTEEDFEKIQEYFKRRK